MPTGSMTEAIRQLSDIHIGEQKRGRAIAAAENLVAVALGDRWNEIPEGKRNTIIRASASRLWDCYMKNRANGNITSKEAAQDAVNDEQPILDQILNPNKKKHGPFGQLTDI